MGRALPIFILKLAQTSLSLSPFSILTPSPPTKLSLSTISPSSTQTKPEKKKEKRRSSPSSLPSRKSKDECLFLIYKYVSGGSLEYHLHGKKGKSGLAWEVRFNVAIGIAEAINYLHNECPQLVIHRDIKSSNILLSETYNPQLSDFGLAIWAPTISSHETGDVVGTFGYLAPEYFMYGKVSNKIDVYSFGVVLLELLTGRKPISSETPKGQESLVLLVFN